VVEEISDCGLFMLDRMTDSIDNKSVCKGRFSVYREMNIILKSLNG